MALRRRSIINFYFLWLENFINPLAAVDFRACDRYKDTIWPLRHQVSKPAGIGFAAACATAIGLAHAVGRARSLGRVYNVMLGFFGKLCIQVTPWLIKDIVMSSDEIG